MNIQIRNEKLEDVSVCMSSGRYVQRDVQRERERGIYRPFEILLSDMR